MTTAGKRIVILGSGFGGLTAANLLRKNLSLDHQIVVVDKKKFFMMGLVNLWILSGIRTLEDSQIALNKLENKEITFLNDEVTTIDISKKYIKTRSNNNKLEYDYLIIALGAELAAEEINGFIPNGGFNLYDAEQIPKLREEIIALRNGRIAICITNIPYKCPPAPYEASLLINDILIKNGMRDSIDIDFYTPAPIALPVAGAKVSQDIVNLLNDNHINFHPLHKLKAVVDKEIIEFENGNKTNYNLLIGVPPHKVPAVIKSSGLVKEGQNWIDVDKFSLKTNYENVFAIGDVTEIKVDQNAVIPKAGIFAEGQAKSVSYQIINEIANQSYNEKFDGRGFCFMEIGSKKAGFLAADFYNITGPITRLDPPSEESYRKKLDFEKNRIKEWLL
ncbi:MAG TPA: FAD/NAD(P)-binding oxidoreductase [Nitrososphaeraceae archaeon]|nr:FAD/NAD(P)-binding oxidoreductase [Nitrososphaeraceae archaeon]